MSKKEKNILQNKRNRNINNRYYSKIKFLSKFLLNLLNKEENDVELDIFKKKAEYFLSQLYRILDKAVNKHVIHQNTAHKLKCYFFNLYKRVKIN
jgi:ribosomal protein S20